MFFNSIEFSLCELSSTNPRDYWKTLKLLVKENSTSFENIPPLRNNDNTYAISDDDKANLLNDFFVSASISSVDDTNTILPVEQPKTRSSIEHVRITESEITDVLSNLIVNKASGPD